MPGTIPQQQIHKISSRETFLYWLRLGFISFGGPAGQIALMHSELVEKRRLISEQLFLHAVMGVIVSLTRTRFFAPQVVHLNSPVPYSAYAAAAITVAACIAMFRFKAGTVKLIFACAITGLVVSYLG